MNHTERIKGITIKVLIGLGVLFIVMIVIVVMFGTDSDDTEVAQQQVTAGQQSVSSTGDTTTEEQQQPATQEIQEQVEQGTKQPTEQSAIEQSAEQGYQLVATFRGNGAKKSEPFTITGSRFKIKYVCDGSLCIASLHSTTGWDMELIMNVVGSTSDETILYNGSGTYYIESNTIGTFTMEVYDYK